MALATSKDMTKNMRRVLRKYAKHFGRQMWLSESILKQDVFVFVLREYYRAAWLET